MTKKFSDSLIREAKTEKEEKEKKIIFIETNPLSAFPNDTISYLQKEIKKKCKDLTVEWKSAIQLLNSVLDEYQVPIPKVYQLDRWNQYSDLIGYTVNNLRDARGMDGSWVKTV